MQYQLSHPQPQPHPLLLAVFLQFMEWAVTILLTIAAFPLLKQAGMFLLMKLYEVFIQYLF
ncbi:hypothetical protein SAMN04488505_102213 [Chitinophaga rupis]|uniref:Uncharacterized protein n=1 Tax=Chitinophaga rupis TaxID=573321 RepID=A0A1H7Q0I0_9BACT|nr:hypothetical protein [Chitinophaga rupis]SEL41228.1 hypothetical protein SAMN04488505_102213 [Chitinophaga rupis]